MSRANKKQTKKNYQALTGNGAVAEVMRQIEPDIVAAYPITPQTEMPDIVAAYPITPQTEIVENFAQFVADGKVSTEFIRVESEHSALSAVVSASAAGARTMTATSSQGLALMHEILFVASGLRLPIVMPVVNRALSAPINIHCDHSDTMAARDSGWIQIYCEDAQEVYDNILIALKVTEDKEILLPAMICQDGFIISHAVANVLTLKDKEVKKFIGIQS
jgi:pyruvate ferredoxin oxidoreductase alpha subunit